MMRSVRVHALTSTLFLSYSRARATNNRNRHRAHSLWVWVHHPRRLPFLRPRFISHGQPHVPHWSDHDDRAASDGEIFRETSKPKRRVLFLVWFTVSVDEMGGSWDDYRVLRVFRVICRIFSNRPFVPATRAGVGDDVTVSRAESVRKEDSEEGTTVTGLKFE